MIPYSLSKGALVALLLGLSLQTAGAQSPTQPAVPSVTDQGEELDSGVGDLDTANWIGKPVMSSDERRVGTLREVQMASDTADSGLLLVDRDGGGTAEIPIAGASFDGTNVIVTPVFESITGN